MNLPDWYEDLLEDACEAQESFNTDDLEKYAEKWRKENNG